jgi:hypothetical protein
MAKKNTRVVLETVARLLVHKTQRFVLCLWHFANTPCERTNLNYSWIRHILLQMVAVHGVLHRRGNT